MFYIAVHTLHFCQPQGLVVMLGWYCESVEEHQNDDQPIKRHRFDGQPALPAAESVPAAPAPTARRRGNVIIKYNTPMWLTLPTIYRSKISDDRNVIFKKQNKYIELINLRSLGPKAMYFCFLRTNKLRNPAWDSSLY